MKSEVETLSPTRVKLTVEVPFEELAPSVDAAYRKVAGQIRIPGFRPGKVPARIVDQRIGRDVVLDEAVNDAIPQFYGQAVEAADVRVLSQPEIEVTSFADGEQLTFTAEVDVRPAIELPELTQLPVTVDDAEVTEADVDEQVKSLADRFGTLTSVERPVEAGDFVSIDLSLSADGKPIEDGTATGLSYEVGSEGLVDGLDSALLGLSAGESAEFDTAFGGPLASAKGRASVTVRSVRTKQLPTLDDTFAQEASEFDTLAELRGDLRSRLERVKRLEQGMQARDNVLEALLGKVEIPLPERTVDEEIRNRRESLEQQLAANGLDLDAYLASQDETLEAHEAHTKVDVERDLRAQFVLDAVVVKEELGIEEAELTEYIVRRASRAGVSPDAYAQQLVSSGTVPLAVADVLRGKALAYVLENAVVTDASGRTVDLNRLEQDVAAGSE
ncbi:MAG TPA: trigger factor [Acidothermaceae bacterium]